jgi:pyruvate dehydrogenase E2 component (dihydrolipoamide acetyltransferase)
MAGSPDVRLAGDNAVVPRVLPQRSLASPLARRIARETQIDLGAIAGSGPYGRIVRRDVEAKRADRSARAAGVAEGKTLPVTGDDAAGVRRILRTIASRLVAATQTVPHFNLTADCTADALLKLRDELASAPGGGRPTLNDWIVKALAVCLQIVPEANVVWAEDRILRLRHSDIGVAVAAGDGLRTPVIRAAETKSLSAVSEGIKALVRMAREQTLSAEDCAGGSCAVSNLGTHGVSSFQPVINPPHAFVLGIGAVEERLVSRNGQPASIHAFTVTMSCDHRVMDGALAARLLAAFKATVEEPMRILV